MLSPRFAGSGNPSSPRLGLSLCQLSPGSTPPAHCFYCYHVGVLMKSHLSTTRSYRKKLLTSFLLVELLFSSTSVVGARNPANAREVESWPTSICSRATPIRNYALTTVPGQPVAGHTSRQNSVKHPVTDGGLAPRESGVPATTVHQLLVATDRSLSYLSFRLSRPGGRAPPASA
jgi:hypothetical protein